jgi:AhpD family alkylhydroperoxidase
VNKSGPLNEKTRALIKLAISTGAGMEGAVYSHTRKAIEAGCSKAEIKQTVILALPTIEFPSTMSLLIGWKL